MKIDYFEQLPEEFVASAVSLYLEAFQDKLNPILGNDGRARGVFKKHPDATHCLAAVVDQRLVGILAVQNSQGSFLNPALKTMTEAYGLPGGILRMLGLALLNHSTAPDELYIDGLAVVEEMRSRGIGSRLLEELEKIALRKKIGTISLEVIDTNPEAEALYQRLGFAVKKQRALWPWRFFFRFPFKFVRLMVKTIR